MPLEGRPAVREDEWEVKITDLTQDPETGAWTVKMRARADELDPWVLSLHYELRDRGLQLVELNLAHPGADQLSMDLLRRLGLTKLGKLAGQALRTSIPEGMDRTQWTLQLPKPGRRKLPDRFYAEWVDKYLTAIETHGLRDFAGPLVDANPGYTRQRIAEIIGRADKYGFITDRPGQGAAGGKMTDKCRQVLGLDWDDE